MSRPHHIPKFLLLIVTLLFCVTACSGNDHREPISNPYRTDPTWTPESISVTCGDPLRCPETVGVLLTVTPTHDGYYVYRCTATLYAADKIVTAGHCSDEMRAESKAYFRTVDRPGKPTRTFPVRRVLKQEYNAGDNFTTDYAAMELATPAVGYTYASPPVGKWPENLKDLTAVVANQFSSTVLTIEALDCEQEEFLNFFAPIAEMPNVFVTKNCKLIKGNSGGPIFARGDWTTVLGVLSRSTAAAEESRSQQVEQNLRGIFKEDRRPKMLPENMSFIASAMCFVDVPGWTPAHPDCLVWSVAQAEKTYLKKRREDIRNLVQAWSREWFERNSTFEMAMGAAKIKVAPLRVEFTHLALLASSSVEIYLNLFPRPLCIKGEAQQGTGRVKFSSRSKKLTPGFLDISLDDSQYLVDGEMSVEKGPGDKWIVQYEFRGPRWDFILDRDTETQLKSGTEIEIPQCSAGDEERYLKKEESLP